ncbi:MAG TPA: dihydrolipoamide acetyltransferase family protein [Capillimicrobium sp.]|nr:dihydrolipoamide acetyltransferase family protein [Capillimicrobium sp.]
MSTTTPKASPTARRLAEELGVDLATVTGSGPGGRIRREDVEAAANGASPAAAAPAAPATTPPATAPAEAPPAAGAVAEAPSTTTVQALTSVQKVVARRMVESRTTVPEFELLVSVDMERAVALRAALKAAAADGQAVPSFNDMVVRASALALREHPRANGSFADGGFRLHERVNVGVAVAAQDALLVPVVADADRKSLGAIARETRALAGRGRDGKLTPAELDGGTFTVSNLGMFGVRSFTAVINVPQAAILAVGALERRPVVHGDEVVPRHVMDLTLCCDHRILYGADAAAFLADLRANLETPERLL